MDVWVCGCVGVARACAVWVCACAFVRWVRVNCLLCTYVCVRARVYVCVRACVRLACCGNYALDFSSFLRFFFPFPWQVLELDWHHLHLPE
mmetsp:Transcript_27124/g.68127  ORF Transcript_27124/g.68127 Transcript_27124/m.68127 type:complete len:91 (+) Transcript_27124:237-509(+)